VAVNVIEVAPAGTVTEPADTGIRVLRVLLLDSETSVPPADAGPLNVTVHVVDAPEANSIEVSRQGSIHC
jgi:hypothetical protein